ncbi:phosphatase PAP2 family protein [Brucellaceae bacterium C25G]
MSIKVFKNVMMSVAKSFLSLLKHLKHPKSSGWTLPMMWVLCFLPLLLLMIHPYDAQLSSLWSHHTSRLQIILAALTNVIKSVYWLLLAAMTWLFCTAYQNRHKNSEQPVLIERVRKASLYLFLAIIFASIPVIVIKYLVGRARPPLLEQFGADYFSPLAGGYLYLSFPSGHAMMAGILMIFSFKFLPRFIWVIAPVLVLLVVSRVVVAAHYPTDVLAGFTIGALMSLWLYNFLMMRNIITPHVKK